MPLSANTLFHFTSTKDCLKKILEENFQIFNCKETVELDDVVTTCYVPMVSFCDIPLSEVKEHIQKYGNYGIGLTKSWGENKGLNPVLYIANKSTLASSYRTAFNHFASDFIEDWSEEQKSLADVLRYLKNYEGELTRKGTTIPKYRYSDEREWRFVPPHTETCDMICPEDHYIIPENKAECDAKLTHLRLEFEPNDIKYIIINDDSEITEFVNHLRAAKGKKYSFHDVERLTTRILTSEQIFGDI